MKRFLFFLFLFTIALSSAFITEARASDVGDVVENVAGGGFATFAALVALTISVTGIVKSIFKGLGGIAALIISWIMGFVITLVGWLLCLGFLCGLTWWEMLLYGLAASLASNGLFDFTSLTGILDVLFKKRE